MATRPSSVVELPRFCEAERSTSVVPVTPLAPCKPIQTTPYSVVPAAVPKVGGTGQPGEDLNASPQKKN